MQVGILLFNLARQIKNFTIHMQEPMNRLFLFKSCSKMPQNQSFFRFSIENPVFSLKIRFSKKRKYVLVRGQLKKRCKNDSSGGLGTPLAVQKVQPLP